jgi:3-oxoadipate enol-lactonase
MGFASVNGIALHYDLRGPEAGPLVALVNSLGTDLRIWADVVPLLAQRHRVLVYDMRGHGLSDAPPGPYQLDDHVADLLAIAALLGSSRFALCGISIGGMIAMRLATRHPEQVSSLLLCDTAATIGSATTWNDRIDAVQRGGMSAVADAVLERWVSPDFRPRRPADFSGWRNMLERGSAQGYIASCAAVRDADLGQDLAHIAAPTLVVAGEHDVVTPPESARALAAAIHGARFQVVAGAGHVPCIEQPEALGALIQTHLDEVAHV